MIDLRRFGDSIALIDGESQTTYRRLAELADEIASHCPSRSLAFILCSNTLASIAGYLGFLEHGIVALLLDSSIDPTLLEGLVSEYRPGYLWAPQGRADSEGWNGIIYGTEGYVLIDRAAESPVALHDDLALLIPTSGSTGSPKLVRQTYGNLSANARSIVSYLNITADDVAITTMPMNYVFGLSIINTHLYQGASIVLTNLTCYSKGFWRLVAGCGVTSFSGVPFMYEMLDKLHFCSRPAPERLRTMTQAGGRLDPALQERFSRWASDQGVRLVIMYGASEATARMSYLPPEYATQKAGSIGIAIPGGRFEVVDENGNLIDAPRTPGELVYYGPNVTMGYALHAEDLALGDARHGRLNTGDIAEFDEDGFFYIVGRQSRFVKIMGKRIGLDEVEGLVAKRFQVSEVAAIGDDQHIVVCTPDAPDVAAVIDYLHEVTGINARLIEVRTGLSIPRTTSGKKGYAELAALVETGVAR